MENNTLLDYELLSIQAHKTSNYKLNVFLKFNEPVSNGILTIEPAEAYKNSKEANFIITSQYYKPKERSIYTFEPHIQLDNISAAQRNEQLENVYVFSGQT